MLRLTALAVAVVGTAAVAAVAAVASHDSLGTVAVRPASDAPRPLCSTPAYVPRRRAPRRRASRRASRRMRLTPVEKPAPEPKSATTKAASAPKPAPKKAAPELKPAPEKAAPELKPVPEKAASEPEPAPKKAAPAPAPVAPALASPKNCVWRQGDANNVVISTAGSAIGAWSEVREGIEFAADIDDDGKIFDAGTDAITYKFTVSKPGRYYITAKTRASASTEHNDMWLRFPTGLKMEKLDGSNSFSSDTWVKAYQNEFDSRNTIYSKDHDPHQFETGALEAGKVYDIMIAGRSTKFLVEKLLLVKCLGTCKKWDKAMEEKIEQDAVSRCQSEY